MNLKTFSTIIILIIVSNQISFSQKYLSSSHQETSELKYLAENRAEEYIDFEVRQMRSKIQIKWSTDEDLSNNVFYILRGTNESNGEIKWDIITTIDNHKSQNKFTYVDHPASNKVYYRLMVVDETEDIQYTSIFKVNSLSI